MRFCLRLWFKIISLEPDIINRQVAGMQCHSLQEVILTVPDILFIQLVRGLSAVLAIVSIIDILKIFCTAIS
jgi:hypothetical protein